MTEDLHWRIDELRQLCRIACCTVCWNVTNPFQSRCQKGGLFAPGFYRWCCDYRLNKVFGQALTWVFYDKFGSWVKSMKWSFAAVCEQLGIDDFHPHDLLPYMRSLV